MKNQLYSMRDRGFAAKRHKMRKTGQYQYLFVPSVPFRGCFSPFLQSYASLCRRFMMLKKMRSLILSVAVVLCFGCAFAPMHAQEPGADPFSALRYRYIGPVGNRTTAVVGIRGQPNIYYAGSASGGIFKTVDGGTHWTPIFDDQPVSSIGSLAIAPSDPNVVWAGTGEAWIRSHISVGNGIYRSTDAGKTWINVGLEKTGRIGRIVVDPHDSNTVCAC